MSRLQKMLEKSASVQGTNEIDPSTVQSSDTPKTGVGMMAQLAYARAKIQELEAAAVASMEVPIANIVPNPWQPRKVFDSEEIQKLADSINELGLIQPVIVRSVPIGNTFTLDERSVGNANTSAADEKSVPNRNTFQLIAGERRWRACQQLGLTDIKSLIVSVSDEDMAMMALAENIARQDLTAYEISKAIIAVQGQFKTAKHLAESVGVNRSELYRYLAFADLPDFVISDLEVTPGILGRAAAMDVMSQIKKHGEAAVSILCTLWPRVKSGDLDQGKIAGLIEAAVTKGDKVTTERDIKKLFVSGQQAGSITRDSSNLTVKIRTVALTPEKEVELRAFVEKMFS